MLASLKRLTKHSVVYGLGHIITRVVNFLLLPLYTNVLPTDEFGATQIVYMFIAVMTILYTFGIDAAFLRYFIMSEDAERKRTVFSTAFWTVLLGVTGFTASVYFGAEEIDAILITTGVFSNYIKIAAFILAFDALAFLPFLYLRAEEKSIPYTILKFVNVLINVGLNIYFIVILKKGGEGMLLANLGASLLTFLMTCYILIKQISFRFEASELKGLLKFGLPFLPAALSVVLLDLIDKPILERLVGLEQTGIYSANAKLGMFMALIVTAFRFAWHPFFLSTSKQENAEQIFSKILTYFTTAALVLFCGLTLFLKEIAFSEFSGVSLLGKEYQGGLNVVPPILLSYVFYGMYVNFMVGIYLKEKTKYLPLITFTGTVVNVVLNIWLLPQIGILGAGWARLAGHVVMAFMLLIFAQRIYPIKYEWGRILKIGLIAGSVFYLNANHGAELLWFVKIGIIFLIPVLLLIFGFFEKRELEMMQKVVRKIIGRSAA